MVGRTEQKKLRINARPEWILSLFLVLSIVAVYHPVVSFEFVNLDDNLYVTENHHVQDGLSLDSIIWAFKTTRASNWHPLTWISHMLDIQLYGFNPGMHHASNLIIHTINCLLLFWILNRSTGTIWQSAIVAALFGLHPINVDSVAWIAQRKNLLSTFFFMLTLLAYVYYVKKPCFGMYMIALLMFALGLISKAIIVTLPFALLLMDFWPLRRIPVRILDDVHHDKFLENRMPGNATVFRLLLEKIPFVLLSTASIVISHVVVQQHRILVSTVMRPMFLRIANAVVSYIAYIGKMIWPASLAVFYPYPETIPFWKTVTAGLILVSISVYSITQIKDRPYLGVGWFWYLGMLFPFAGLSQAGLWPAMADRWAYLPLIGLFICTAWAGMEIISKVNVGRVGIGIVMLLVFSALISRTMFQVQHWRNSVTLLEHALASTSDNYVVHNNLANVLEWNGNTVEAKAHYLKALRIKPEFFMARYNLGNLLKSEGRTPEAIEHYRKVLQINPDYAPAHNNLATALISVSEIEKVIAHSAELSERKKDLSTIRYHLKNARELRNKLDEAIFHFREALRIASESDTLSNNIKQAMVFRKKIDEAVIKLQNIRHISKQNES